MGGHVRTFGGGTTRLVEDGKRDWESGLRPEEVTQRQAVRGDMGSLKGREHAKGSQKGRIVKQK